MTLTANIVGYGMACPVGLRAEFAVATMRAGLNVFETSDLVTDRAGEPVSVSMLSTLAPEASRMERMLELARRAVAQACEPLRTARGLPRIPCFLSLPAPGHGGVLDEDAIQVELGKVVGRINSEIALEFGPASLFGQGRSGPLWALRAAVEAIAQGRAWLALVGGVDSLVDRETLWALADDDRLLSATRRDGLIPGEGAGFVLVAHPGISTTSIAARVMGSAVVPADPARGGDVGRELGLAFAQLRDIWDGRVDQVVSAQTGQSKDERALSYAYLRNASLMPEPMRRVSVGACVGDAGAAAGALALVRACVGLRAPKTPGFPQHPPEHDSALVYAQSDDGSVGACIIAPGLG